MPDPQPQKSLPLILPQSFPRMLATDLVTRFVISKVLSIRFYINLHNDSNTAKRMDPPPSASAPCI